MIGTSLEQAKKRFPFSKNKIQGSGNYVLMLCCWRPWRIRLFPTVQERDEAYRYFDGMGCGAPNGCTRDHKKGNAVKGDQSMETNQVTIELTNKPLNEIHDEVQQVAGPEVAAQVTTYAAILRASEAISGSTTTPVS